MARVTWKPNDLVSLKLRDDLYTLGQMLTSPFMRFFDISNDKGNWANVDLDKIGLLFEVAIGRVVLQKMAVGKVRNEFAKPSTLAFESKVIKPFSNYDGGFPFRGGRLIDIGPEGKASSVTAPIIVKELILPRDRDIIEKYEMTNMWGDQDLSDRLVRYFDTGINRDDLKFEVFPGLWNDREKLQPLTRRLPIPSR